MDSFPPFLVWTGLPIKNGYVWILRELRICGHGWSSAGHSWGQKSADLWAQESFQRCSKSSWWHQSARGDGRRWSESWWQSRQGSRSCAVVSSGAWAPLPVSTGRESVVVKTLEVLDQEVVASAGKRSPFCTRVAVGALLRSHPLDGWKKMATGKMCGSSGWNWHAKANGKWHECMECIRHHYISTTFPVHFHYISTTFPLHFQYISTTFPVHFHYISTTFPVHFQYISTTFPLHFQYISTTFPVHFHYISTTFPLHFQYISTTFPLHFHYISSTFPLHFHYISTTFPVHFHYISSTFPLHFHYISTTFPLHFQYISTTFPLHLHYISSTFPLHFQYISTTFPLHFHYISTTFPVHFHYISSTFPVHFHYISTTFPVHFHYISSTFPLHFHYISTTFPLHFHYISSAWNMDFPPGFSTDPSFPSPGWSRPGRRHDLPSGGCAAHGHTRLARAGP